jgi:hypothetical protein
MNDKPFFSVGRHKNFSLNFCFVFVFLVLENQTQDLGHARQVLYHGATSQPSISIQQGANNLTQSKAGALTTENIPSHCQVLKQEM